MVRPERSDKPPEIHRGDGRQPCTNLQLSASNTLSTHQQEDSTHQVGRSGLNPTSLCLLVGLFFNGPIHTCTWMMTWKFWYHLNWIKYVFLVLFVYFFSWKKRKCYTFYIKGKTKSCTQTEQEIKRYVCAANRIHGSQTLVTAAFNCCKITEWCAERFAATSDYSQSGGCQLEAECTVGRKLRSSELASIGLWSCRRWGNAAFSWSQSELEVELDSPDDCHSHLPFLLVAFVQLAVGRLPHQADLTEGNTEAECCFVFHH